MMMMGGGSLMVCNWTADREVVVMVLHASMAAGGDCAVVHQVSIQPSRW